MSEATVEAEIVAKGKTAPRITPADIDHQIVSISYINPKIDDRTYVLSGENAPVTAALGCLTLCVLVLRNGFTVVGKSACASPENFDQELGNRIAQEDARRQIWALEGYRLRSKLAEG